MSAAEHRKNAGDRRNEHGNSPRARRRRAALLLEVVVAFGIVTAALGLLGAQLTGGFQMVQYAEQQTRASELGDRILALLELDQNLQQQIFVDNDKDGDFGTEYPGWFWRITVEPTQTDGLGAVGVEILFDEKLGNDIESARVVRELHMLKADPGRINLQTDFGFSEDQVAQLTDNVQIPGFDPNALDPQALVSLPPEQLLLMLGQLLPLLQQLANNAGINADQVPQTPEDAAAMLNSLNGLQTGNRGGGIPDSGGNKQSAGGDLSPDAAGGGNAGSRNTGARNGGATIEDLIRLRDQGAGGRGAGTGNTGSRGGNTGNAGGAGNRGGAGNAGGAPPGNRPVDVRPGNSGSGGNAGSRGNTGNRGNSGNRGNTNGGASNNGQPHYTIEDLIRLRDGQPLNK